MIDLGLLLSMVVTLGVPIVVARRWSSGGERSGDTDPLAPDLLDVVLGPLLAGLVVARLTAIVLDDPAAFGRVTDVLIIRSGVEFWPGVVVAAIVAAAAARRSGVAVMARLAALVPLGLLGTAGYEATCVVRGGCFGPTSPVGLRPQGSAPRWCPSAS
ncbi:MAG: hypothetical protein R2733_23785 [Acidimicrobiales bacterium]